jgi:hypothetical protein
MVERLYRHVRHGGPVQGRIGITGVLHGLTGVSTLTSLLFGDGQAGAMYDPSDLSTLWQDSAGTTPVTSDGDPVGRMDDISGNGYHLVQSSASSRPIYRNRLGLSWLELDGADDCMLAPGYDQQAFPLVVAAGLSTSSGGVGDAMFGVLMNDTGINKFRFIMDQADNGFRLWDWQEALGSTTFTVIDTQGAYVEGRFESGNIQHQVEDVLSAVATPANTFGDASHIALGSFQVAGAGFAAFRFYGGVVRDQLLSVEERIALRAWLENRMYVTDPLGDTGLLLLLSSAGNGAWYDISDLSTLWQDAAGTVPVTSDGDPVGRVDDKSGNGHHVTQSTASKRPIYKVDASGNPYLRGGGVSNPYLLVNTTLNLTQPTSIATSVKPDTSGSSYINDAGPSSALARNALFVNSNEWTSYAGTVNQWSGKSVVDNKKVSLVGTFNGTNSIEALGGEPIVTGANAGSMPMDGITLLSRYSDITHWLGDFYGLVILDAEMSVGEIENLLRHFASKSGARP